MSQNTLFDYVLLYNDLGWATFPTLISKDPKKDKSPLAQDWPTRVADPISAMLEEEAYARAGAFGVVLRPDDLVIDIDPRNFREGDKPWLRLKADLKLPDPLPAPVVKTGGGGYHVYMKKPADFNTVFKLKDYPGIEIKSGGKNAYVIGAGSKHSSGKEYKIVAEYRSLGTIYNAPRELLTLAKKEATAVGPSAQTVEFRGGIQEYNRYIEYLKLEREKLAERGNDAQRFRVACVGRDYGLPELATFAAMREHYNSFCEPVWDDAQLRLAITNAYKYASGEVNSEVPSVQFAATLPPGVEWDSEPDETRGYDTNKSGIIKTLKNAVNYLYTNPAISGTVRLNQFTGDIELTGKLPWSAKRKSGDIWSDHDVVLLKYLMSKTLGVEFSVNILWEAVHTVAMRYAYHPVQEYIQSCTWDNTPRVDRWLSHYCEVEDNEYTRAVGRKFLVALIARVFQPGVKFDYALVLEGDQGIGKSSVCAALGGKWYGDIIVDPHNRDTVDAMRGKWLIELSEMEVTRRADVTALKAFLSRTSDRARLAYARAALDFPRQCVFAGTVNPDGMGYLVDQTGNRRFWPVSCGRIDYVKLKEERDLLFAEAYKIYKEGEELFLKGDVLKHAVMAQGAREAIDPWQDAVQAWLNQHGEAVTELSVPDVWETILGGQSRNLTRSDQIRIGYIFKRLGWWKWRPLHGGSRQSCYKRPIDKSVDIV